eukprot:TRINITY_DN504_c0_g1_i2.p2 TRINITY_DN504_c0_g1~~TRINITY_DN504_c0_g1_i2.p2  ORF type:complete len:468 (+),score=196.71 TRINITY_DN504_c0_g1_i2:60-1406(+)
MKINAALCLLGLAASAAAQGPCACAAGSTCCRDSPDPDATWECCMDQATSCVPMDTMYTSRCCPKWTVGCQAGSVGCCDPARPYSMPFGDLAAVGQEAASPATAVADTAAGAGSAGSAYALVTKSGLFSTTAQVLKMDPLSGKVLAKHTVRGAVADYVAKKLLGATPRPFEFDARARHFHSLDVLDGALTLLSVDADSGASTSAAVTGVEAGAYPTGMAYDAEAGRLVFSFPTEAGFAFFTAAVPAGSGSVAATKVAEVARGGSEATSAQYYAGYMTRSYNLTAHRMGQKEVTLGAGPGVAAVDLAAGGKGTEWTTVETVDLWSLDKAGSGARVSLAAGAKGFDLVQWDASSATHPTQLTTFAGCYPPLAGQLGGALGYVGTAVAGRVFTSMVLEHTVVKVKQTSVTVDNWVLASYDLEAGAAYVNRLSPEFLLSDTVALGGFGAVAA